MAVECFLKWLYDISPSLVAVILGGILVQRFFVRRANLSGLVDRICDCLDRLSNDCAEYWSIDFAAEKQHSLAILEARIKAEMLQINAMILAIHQKYGNVPSDIRIAILELQDHCTGGAFESHLRKADRHRYMRIVSSIAKIAVELHRLKI